MADGAAASMAAVAAALAGLGYGPSYFRTVRAALHKAAKVYDRPLARIPACPDAFEERWGRDPGYVRFGFTSLKQFRAWRSTMRGVLARFARRRVTGDWRGAPRDGAWRRIADFVRDAAPGLGLVSRGAFMPFATFVSVAAEDGIAPAAVDEARIARALVRLGYGRRKRCLAGLGVFNALIASPAAQAALPGLLPAAPIAPPPRPVAKGGYAGFLPAEIPPAVRADFDAWLDRKRHGAFGDGLTKGDDKTAFTDSSARAYGHAIGWLWRTLAAAGRIDPGGVAGLADLLTCRNILDAARLFRERRADPASGLARDAGSLHAYVGKTTRIALEHCAVPPAEREKLRELRRHRFVRTPSVAGMASDRAQWLRDLARDDRLQRRLLGLPELLTGLSRDILARWDALADAGKRVERMRGLKLGVAAAQAAILFHGKPIRAGNLRHLRIWCDERTLVLPSGRARSMLLSIPGEEVKNGKPIEGELDPEAWPVLRFYLGEVRPRLIEAHPFGRNCADSSYLFCSPRPDRPMEASVFAAAYAAAMREAGLDMTLHLARHASVFFLLDEDPNAWAEAAELLGDTETTVHRHYAFMSERKVHRAARATLRRARVARLGEGA